MATIELGGGIAFAGLSLGAAYFGSQFVKHIASRGNSRTEAYRTAIEEGIRHDVLNREDVLDPLDEIKVEMDD